MHTNQSRDVLTTTQLGFHVSKAASDLPSIGVTDDLFTVTGGRVEITLMLGEVTTVIEGTNPVLKITANPDTGSTIDLASTVDTSSLEKGGFLHVLAALTKSNAGAVLSVAKSGQVVPEGVIGLYAGATKTGAIKWDLWYVPLDEGATVAASA